MSANTPGVNAFDIALRPLIREQLPILQVWRNSPEILPYMEDQRETTIATLDFWFAKMQKQGKSCHYLVWSNDQPVAYTELRDINQQTQSCQDGIFVFGSEYQGTGISHRIMLCREIVMQIFSLYHFSNTIHINNTASLKFYQKYDPIFLGQTGNFYKFQFPFSRRRNQLQKIASLWGMGDEFAFYFG